MSKHTQVLKRYMTCSFTGFQWFHICEWILDELDLESFHRFAHSLQTYMTPRRHGIDPMFLEISAGKIDLVIYAAHDLGFPLPDGISEEDLDAIQREYDL